MFTAQPSYMYEDLQPEVETTETTESLLLHVPIPDGFTRSDIGAKIEYDFGRVRVFGERSSGPNKRSRFNINYQVPSYCDTKSIKGKIEGNIITITMPVIPGAKVPPKQKPTQEQASPPPKPVVQETQPKDQDNVNKENIPPQSSKEENNAAEVKDQKGDQEDTSVNKDPKSSVENKDDVANESSTPQNEQKVTMPQKGHEKISQKSDVTKVESKKEADHEISTPQEEEEKVTIPQKGQEEISKVESKGEVDHETSTTREATQDSMPKKGQEKVAATNEAKLQKEENNTARLDDENKEKHSFEKEETKDHLKKTTSELGKKHVVDDSPTPEKEIKEESKGSDGRVESVTTTRHIEKEKVKEMNGNIVDDTEKKSDIKGMTESTRTRIRDMATSTTKAVTSLAKRLNEDDKQKLIYTGAAILIVGLSVYASYKYRSSRKP